MKLIVGLGNPGAEYTFTRHNIGFRVVEEIQHKLELPPFKLEQKFKAEITQGIFENEKIILAKPITFMNKSGEAVQKISSFFKIPTEDIIVIYDDIDLPLGKLRIRIQGTPGTHNGLKSINSLIGSKYPRIKLGIESRGLSAPKQQQLSDFVLSAFTKEEEQQLPTLIKKSTEAALTMIENSPTEAMNKFN